MTKLYTLLGLLLAFSLNSFAQITITTEDWGTCPAAGWVDANTTTGCASTTPSPGSGGNYIELQGNNANFGNTYTSPTI